MKTAAHKLHMILVGLGSAGDVHPSVGIGRLLLQRGHRVTLVAPSVFRHLAAQTGLEFFGLGSDEEHEAIIRNPDLWNPMKAFPLVARHIMLNFMRPVYEFVARNYVKGKTVVAAPGTSFGARLANEQLGVPLATVHLQPSLLRSSLDPSCYAIPDILRMLPRWLRKPYYRLIDFLAIDRLLAPETNAFRAELGLPPVKRFFDGWLHSPEMVIGLFPDWFAPRPADWPPHFHHTGFPLWDEGDVRPNLPEFEDFLSAGDRPWVFTAGSANMHGHNFFRAAVDACQAAGRRGILLARYAEQIPVPLPANVRHFEYIPFSQALPRAAALAHHGGIGTTAQAFAAGTPQLVMPLAHDQFDNAIRVRRLGAGDFLLPGKFNGAAVATCLERLTDNRQVAEATRKYAMALKDAAPLETTCDLLESLAP